MPQQLLPHQSFAPGTLFARIFHASPVAMTITALDDGCYIDVNEAYATLVGVRREGLLNRTNHEFRLTDALGGNLLAEVASGSGPVHERKSRLRTAHGDFRHVIASAQIHEWGGRTYVFTLLQDLTDFKRAEDALRASEARSRLFFESVPLPVFVYDLETLRILDFNKAAVEQYGFSSEELYGMDMLDVRPAEERDKFRRHVPTMPEETRQFGIWRHWKKDGTVMDMEVTGYALVLDGRPARLAVCRDVTEQLKIQEALRASEERHRIFADVTNDVLWDVDIPADRVGFSDGLRAVFGYQIEERVPLNWWVARVHQEERAAVRDGFFKALDGDDCLWSAQYRFRRQDGQYAHVLDRGYIYRDEDGRPQRMIGAMIDITRQLEMKEAATRAAMDERRRLARDLHDAVTQSLYSLSLLAEAARRHAKAGDWQATDEYVDRLGQLAQQSLKELRLLVYELRPSVLEKEGLVGALQARLDAVERHSGIQARLTVDMDRKLSPQAQLQYYRVAEEALNNALKHAAATAVHIKIQSDDNTATLEISDNGQGFDPSTMTKGGLGLISMRERLEKMGGRFELITTPGQGTTVRVKSGHVDGNNGQHNSDSGM